MGVLVTKADGSKQSFDRAKVVRTCLRMGANGQTAYDVAEKVERRLYDGISTAKILKMIFYFMRRYRPDISHLFDLRKGLSLMGSKPEFEKYVQVLLAHNGFEVAPNQTLNGKCGEHEVDAIARKNDITYFVEAKHHTGYHTSTGLDESRIARAVLEDVTEGFALGRNSLKIDRAIIVTNTRYSEHAIRYGGCRNILQIGWNSPANLGLQNMIEEKNLYPLSCLRSLRGEDRMKLVNSGIVLMKQMNEEDPAELSRKTGLPQQILEKIKEQSQPNIFIYGSQADFK